MPITLLPLLVLMFLAYNGEAMADHQEIEAQVPGEKSPQTITVEDFLEYVVDDVNDFWEQAFARRGYSYSPPQQLVLVDDRPERTGCRNLADGSPTIVEPEGMPLYCPEDQNVYFPLNATFPDPNNPNGTRLRLDRQEDFAIAVAIAHEMAHHAQRQLNRNRIPNLAELHSLTSELQADCFAGVWAKRVYNNRQLEQGDLEVAAVVLYFVSDPQGLTPYLPQAHGDFEQRISAFSRGFSAGDTGECF